MRGVPEESRGCAERAARVWVRPGSPICGECVTWATNLVAPSHAPDAALGSPRVRWRAGPRRRPDAAGTRVSPPAPGPTDERRRPSASFRTVRGWRCRLGTGAPVAAADPQPGSAPPSRRPNDPQAGEDDGGRCSRREPNARPAFPGRVSSLARAAKVRTQAEARKRGQDTGVTGDAQVGAGPGRSCRCVLGTWVSTKINH